MRPSGVPGVSHQPEARHEVLRSIARVPGVVLCAEPAALGGSGFGSAGGGLNDSRSSLAVMAVPQKPQKFAVLSKVRRTGWARTEPNQGRRLLRRLGSLVPLESVRQLLSRHLQTDRAVFEEQSIFFASRASARANSEEEIDFHHQRRPVERAPEGGERTRWIQGRQRLLRCQHDLNVLRHLGIETSEETLGAAQDGKALCVVDDLSVRAMDTASSTNASSVEG